VILTEEEAKKKWCPFAREGLQFGGPHGVAAGNNCCIASDCMMWRQLAHQEGLDPQFKPPGFCGLASKP